MMDDEGESNRPAPRPTTKGGGSSPGEEKSASNVGEMAKADFPERLSRSADIGVDPDIKAGAFASGSASSSGGKGSPKDSPQEDEKTSELSKKRPAESSPERSPPSAPSTQQKKSKPTKQFRTKKPKDMPRRPLSAYNLYFREERERLIAEVADRALREGREREGESYRPPKRPPKIGFEEMAKIIGKRWKELPPSAAQRYKDLAKAEMTIYRAAVEKYKSDKASEMTSAFDDAGAASERYAGMSDSVAQLQYYQQQQEQQHQQQQQYPLHALSSSAAQFDQETTTALQQPQQQQGAPPSIQEQLQQLYQQTFATAQTNVQQQQQPMLPQQHQQYQHQEAVTGTSNVLPNLFLDTTFSYSSLLGQQFDPMSASGPSHLQDSSDRSSSAADPASFPGSATMQFPGLPPQNEKAASPGPAVDPSSPFAATAAGLVSRQPQQNWYRQDEPQPEGMLPDVDEHTRNVWQNQQQLLLQLQQQSHHQHERQPQLQLHPPLPYTDPEAQTSSTTSYNPENLFPPPPPSSSAAFGQDRSSQQPQQQLQQQHLESLQQMGPTAALLDYLAATLYQPGGQQPGDDDGNDNGDGTPPPQPPRGQDSDR